MMKTVTEIQNECKWVWIIIKATINTLLIRMIDSDVWYGLLIILGINIVIAFLDNYIADFVVKIVRFITSPKNRKDLNLIQQKERREQAEQTVIDNLLDLQGLENKGNNKLVQLVFDKLWCRCVHEIYLCFHDSNDIEKPQYKNWKIYYEELVQLEEFYRTYNINMNSDIAQKEYPYIKNYVKSKICK